MSDNDNYFKDIQNTITNYLSEKNTDYGIMLTGEWGAGKTYYVKNYLGYVEEESKFNKPLYISVAGKSNVEEVINDLFLLKILGNSSNNKLNIIKTIANNGGKALLETLNFFKFNFISSILPSIFNIGKNISKEKLSFENVLVILDDLERLSKKINIEDLLYSIYDNFISNNVKVLFICNEKVLIDNNEEYNKIKEKIIRYTIKLHSMDEYNFKLFLEKYIIKNLIDEQDIENYYISNDFFYKQCIPNIINIFIKMRCYNIRTFKKFFDMSKYFLNEINNFIYKEEYKLNNNEELFLEILRNFAFVLIKHDLNQDIELLSNDIILKKESSNDINEFSEDEKKLYSKNYIEIIDMMKKLEFNYNVSVFYFYKYILSGDISYFSKIVEAYKDDIYLDKEYLKALDTIRECDDGFDEIKRNADLIIEKMKNKKYYFSIKECWQIYVLLFIRYKDLFIDEKDKYLQVIKDTLKFCWENEDYNSILETKNAHKSKDLNWHSIPVLIEEIYKNNNDDILIKYESDLLNELTKNGKPIDEKIVIKLIEKFNLKDKDYFYNKISYEEKVLLFTNEVINKLPRTIFVINIYFYFLCNVSYVASYYSAYRKYYDDSINIIDMLRKVLSFVNKIETTDRYFIFVINELKNLLKEKYKCTEYV